MAKRKNDEVEAQSRRIRLKDSPDYDALSLPTPETPRFRGSQSPENASLAPPTQEMRIFPRSPSPESAWNRGVRGIFSNYSGEDQNSDVINRATPEPYSIFTATSNAISTIKSQLPRLTEDVGLGFSIARTKLLQGGVVDDKIYELESVIKAASSLPAKSKQSRDLSGLLVKPLWNDLHHPPLSYLGDEYRYRKADGSNNNIMYPHLGAAGSSYARTVSPQTLTPAVKPDPGLLFDTIFARQEKIKEHPNQISSVLFYLASIITHDIFRTDEDDKNKLKNSSYLDLSPLYGNSDVEGSDGYVGDVREFKDGLLKADTFNETRVYSLPPGVAVLLICFNRFHNYVASQLKEINEGGRFSPKSPPRTEAQKEIADKKIDEDLFQTARLITCGLYVNIILHDYVRTILNLQTTDNSWTLDPRTDSENIFDPHGVPVGIGNQVSVEFNLVYRWHSSISTKDVKWIEKLYEEIFDDEDIYRHLENRRTFYTKAGKYFDKIKAKKPEQRELRHLKRRESVDGKVGKYDDGELAKILREATDDVAGAFGPKNVPMVMKVIEVMGIEQARGWGVCTLNEFRKFFNLKPHRSFTDISSDRAVANSLQALYSKPDYVELYPGLIAEDAKAPIEPGSGLCPGFTTSRTILADAVALTRGDRFYTVDYTPANLTNWGWNLIKSDPEVCNGHVIHNLLMRAMPAYYRGTSVYAMFPLVHPSRTKEIMTKLGTVGQYDFTKPSLMPHPIIVESYETVARILKDQDSFKVPWGPHTTSMTGKDYMLSGDSSWHRRQRHDVKEDLQCPCDWAQQVKDYYSEATTRLIEGHCDQLQPGTYQTDIVHDVANPSHTIFVAQMYNIPIKDSEDRLMSISTKDLYTSLSVLFAYVFLDQDTAKSCRLKAGAAKATHGLSQLLRVVVERANTDRHLHWPSAVFKGSESERLLSGYGKHMIRRLIQRNRNVDDVVAEILPTAAAAVATQAQSMTQMLDLYLKKEYRHHWADIRRCAYSDEPEDFKRLQKYALEACRLEPTAFGLLRVAEEGGSIKDHGKTVEYQAGSLLYTDFVKAGRDPAKFGDNADEIDINRPTSSYIHQGVGPHACVGFEMSTVALATQLGLFAKLKNLRRAEGQAGNLKYTTKLGPGKPNTVRAYMREDWSGWWPFPTTMKVLHEGLCDTLAEHDLSSPSLMPEQHIRADSAVSLIPEIRMDGYASSKE